ncbi:MULTISPECIES: hypothetical protein [Amycolatopsis]|uniref:Uncharacterized protein n=1 Tax=Amycolatopsis minnesotensis TaxID=337894 RepID=A0ABN2QEA7_9PSEU|nr:hypothetical protein [Amycolatopsis sp. CA-230715]QWF77362.1 hypothetical protein HUW46_00754 [Amycolatopsis sp. CA-230715]
MLDGLSDWWDRAELWLAQLWFPLQFLLVIAVLGPLCLGLAWVIDKAVAKVAGWFASARREEPRRRS